MADAMGFLKAGDRGTGGIANEFDLTEPALRELARRGAIDVGAGPPGAPTTAEREELARRR